MYGNTITINGKVEAQYRIMNLEKPFLKSKYLVQKWKRFKLLHCLVL